MKPKMIMIATALIVVSLFAVKCKKDDLAPFNKDQSASNLKLKKTLDTPILDCGTSTQASINIVVTAGASGAPAGFTIQWETMATYKANLDATGNGWSSDTLQMCGGSFSGNANLSRYNLSPFESVTVNAGELLIDNGASTNCPDALLCGTAYVFRAFAHANSIFNRSVFTPTLTCQTLPCNSSGGCTYSQGYRKTHGPTPAGNNTNMWPASGTPMFLGSVKYTDMMLLQIFNTPAAGNGLIALAHQLIAAKLNIANGANNIAISSIIATADALIGGLVIPPGGTGYLSPAQTSALITTLTNFNEGATGFGYCN